MRHRFPNKRLSDDLTGHESKSKSSSRNQTAQSQNAEDSMYTSVI